MPSCNFGQGNINFGSHLWLLRTGEPAAGGGNFRGNLIQPVSLFHILSVSLSAHHYPIGSPNLLLLVGAI